MVGQLRALRGPAVAARRRRGAGFSEESTAVPTHVAQTNGIPFGVGTTHFRTYFSGDWDVHWGYDLGFDPWPDASHQMEHTEPRESAGASFSCHPPKRVRHDLLCRNGQMSSLLGVGRDGDSPFW